MSEKEVNEKATGKKATSFEIKPEERQSWVSLAMIWTGSMICIPCLMIGSLLGSNMTIPSMILAVLVGYGIVVAYMCFMGMEGCDTGLPTVIMAASALGEKGSKFIISLLLSIACIGWYGVQAAVCGASFSAMLAGMTGIVIPVWISSIVWGFIMLISAVYGYNAIKYLNYIGNPALLLLIAYCIFLVFTKFEVVQVLNTFQPENPMPIISAIALVVGSFALGGVISGDYSRYAKSRADVVKSSVLGVLPAGLVVLLIGSVMSIVTGEYDISTILSAMGVPAIGLVALILATWTTNVTNAYSGGIAVANLIGAGENKRPMTTAIAGMAGTMLAAFGIMDQFQGFLGILTALIPPVAGVIIASYWIVGKGNKDNFKISGDFNIVGLIAFVLGAAVTYITGNVFVFFISPINGIIVSIAAYVCLNAVMNKEVAQG